MSKNNKTYCGLSKERIDYELLAIRNDFIKNDIIKMDYLARLCDLKLYMMSEKIKLISK
jgi:hypothetical protein